MDNDGFEMREKPQNCGLPVSVFSQNLLWENCRNLENLKGSDGTCQLKLELLTRDSMNQQNCDDFCN